MNTGRGWYIWKILRCGDIASIVDLAVLSHVSHLWIKIADGVGTYNGELARELTLAAQAVGIEVYGWQYLYLTYPTLDAEKAAQRVQDTGVTGFVMDCESECKLRPERAPAYCNKLKQLLPTLPIGLSSYRFPSMHPELPWRVYRDICTFDAPQMYWMFADNPGAQLRRCVGEFSAMTPRLPMTPTGVACLEHGWQPTAAQVVEFMTTCGELGLPSFNFWEWYDARFVLPPDIWDAIANFDQPQLPPHTDLVTVNTDTLNIRNLPVIDPATLIGRTYRGQTWEVTGRIKDGLGREWIQSGPSAHLAGWLVK